MNQYLLLFFGKKDDIAHLSMTITDNENNETISSQEWKLFIV